MTQVDILRIAQEAQLVRFEGGENEAYQLGQASPDDHSRAYWSIATPEKLELFATLIEKHLSYDGIHTCNDQCQRPACLATRRAVEREREACAQVVEEYPHWIGLTAKAEISNAIRARGKR
jgi:hypothetical protein